MWVLQYIYFEINSVHEVVVFKISRQLFLTYLVEGLPNKALFHISLWFVCDIIVIRKDQL